MIDFTFTDSQLAARDLAREFCGRECAPYIADWDRSGGFPPELLRKMGEIGLAGLCFPEEYGGSGLDYIALGLVCEEMEYVDTSLRVFFSVHVGLSGLSILTCGTDEQKRKYLHKLATAELVSTFGLTEPDAGSDVVGIRSTADEDGDSYVLNGEKMWISLADRADMFTIYAWTDREKMKKRDHTGITGFIVERDFGGIETGSIKGKTGIRAGDTGFVSMTDVRVPKENVLGEVGEGFKLAMFSLDQGRYTVAAGATGLIRAARDASVAYAKERKTFGRPIAKHQLVKAMIANMVREYEASHLLWLRAGWLKTVGERSTRETSLAKWYATVASERCASDAIEVHGAYGYSDEYPVERFWRNSRAAVIYEGTREVHALMQADYALGFREDRPTRRSLPTVEQQ
jgi:glutaryl-CoA dehydrogenase (non-decarboxylating)